MELYSLGVDGGYTQADVIAMANLLTGWSVYADRPNGFNFFASHHEPGSITLRGKTYPAVWMAASPRSAISRTIRRPRAISPASSRTTSSATTRRPHRYRSSKRCSRTRGAISMRSPKQP